MNPFSHCQFLLLLLIVHNLLCYRTTGVRSSTIISVVVNAANIGRPSTVRPLLPPRRSSFLSSHIHRRAAKEAYLRHLQNELEVAQRQLYTSQNTCTTLRKRWEDQRMETLDSMVSHDRSKAEDITIEEIEQQKQQLIDQEKEIVRLKELLEMETKEQNEQLERIQLMSEELNELLLWKENEQQTTNTKLSEYEHQLQESQMKQREYLEQVQLLELKLEAADLVIKQREGGSGKSTITTNDRREGLRSELEHVRTKYLHMLINLAKEYSAIEGGNNANRVKQMQIIEQELDSALSATFESALDTIDKEWSVRFESLQRVGPPNDEEVNSTLDETIGSSRLSKSQKRQLTSELTDSLTKELTEKLTMQLTTTLVKEMEQKYKKKMKRLRKELKGQQTKVMELMQTQDVMSQQHREIIDAEIEKVKDQFKQEYESKVHQLQAENDVEIEMQKERMRKLARALLEREAKKKQMKEVKVNVNSPVAEEAKPIKSSPSKRKKRRRESASGTNEAVVDSSDGDPDDDMVSSLSRVASVRENR